MVTEITRSAVLDRLEQYRILPPNHDRLPTNTLEQIEQLFVTWYELSDDASRRAALSYVLPTENETRAALLAIVPLYYDVMFFDERTPTRDLVEIALVAHAKWRRWLSADAVAS
jgi:galactose-1-phosphate uridylyltransferase